MKKYIIAKGSQVNCKTWTNVCVSWDELKRLCNSPRFTDETSAEYAGMSKSERSKQKDGSGFVGGELTADGPRRKDTIKNRCLITLDADQAGPHFIKRCKDVFPETAMIFYETHSSTKESPRYRLIMPLKEPCTAEQYPKIANAVMEKLGSSLFDTCGANAEHLMFFPSFSKDYHPTFDSQEGEELDGKTIIDAVCRCGQGLGMMVPAMPRTDKVAAAPPRVPGLKQNPLEAPGWVGAFCRVYTVPNAIDKFLPDIYKRENNDRYTFRNGTTTGGLVIFENGLLARSFHGTDPANEDGHEQNAFDLVRVHKYGTLDAKSDGRVKESNKKSFQKMIDLCRHDTDVEAEAVKGGFGEDAQWLEKCEFKLKDNKKPAGPGNIASTIDNFYKLINNCPDFSDHVYFDLYAHRVMIHQRTPWRDTTRTKIDETWKNGDYSQLRNFCECYMGLYDKKKTDDAFECFLNNHTRNPLKEFFDSLQWDGTERSMYYFRDYAGADDNAYTRAVSTLFFRAIVKRTYSPGCKYDYVISLVGPEGIGKSGSLSEIMPHPADDEGDKLRPYYCNTLGVIDTEWSTTNLQGKALIEDPEMSSRDKTTGEKFKAFVSTQVDHFREPFKQIAEDYPRTFIVCATTNNKNFLKGTEGDRRFLPIDCQRMGTKNPYKMNESEQNQLWAEAVYKYKQNPGEELVLPAELKATVLEEQRGHNEIFGSTLAARIEDYIMTKKPATWPKMRSDEKGQWYCNVVQGDSPNYLTNNKTYPNYICISELTTCLFYRKTEKEQKAARREMPAILNSLPYITERSRKDNGGHCMDVNGYRAQSLWYQIDTNCKYFRERAEGSSQNADFDEADEL